LELSGSLPSRIPLRVDKENGYLLIGEDAFDWHTVIMKLETAENGELVLFVRDPNGKGSCTHPVARLERSARNDGIEARIKRLATVVPRCSGKPFVMPEIDFQQSRAG
jgi:hypothetical protein